jgi:hypothetical protein
MTAVTAYASALNWLPIAQLAAVEAHLESRPGTYAVVNGTKVADREAMFERFSSDLFEGAPVKKWAQLEDLLHQRVLGAPGEYAIIWLEVHHMLDHAVPDLVEACDVFLRKARSAREHGGRFRVFLIGEGPNFT